MKISLQDLIDKQMPNPKDTWRMKSINFKETNSN